MRSKHNKQSFGWVEQEVQDGRAMMLKEQNRTETYVSDNRLH
jgi:hypothetical protein